MSTMTISETKVISATEIKNLIEQGKLIVIYDDYVLNLSSWIERHPGGDKAVFHMIGRDATDEMNAYHNEETMKMCKRWRIGKIDHKWKNLLPPIQGGNRENGFEDLTNGDVGARKKTSKKDRRLFPSNNAIRDPEVIYKHAYDTALLQNDIDNLPSLDSETQTLLSEKYNALHKRVIEKGLYQCPYGEYFKEFCRISSLFLFSACFFRLNWLGLSAVFLGCAWQQLTFVAHDASHIAITHDYIVDNLIGMTVANWVGGLSLGWWKRNHNVHHLITNDPVHDPDIQHLPFFAVSTRLFDSVYSTYYDKVLDFDAVAKVMVKIQNYTYYPILCFGRFNLYRLSWTHLINGDGPRKGKAAWFRYYELVGLSFFFYWFFYLVVFKSIDNWSDRLLYVMVSHITTMIVHVQITLSHFAMSTSNLGVDESFVSRQLRTTMDVDCPEWLDYFHGGLQFQAIHHLFPRLPRHNLRKTQDMVVEFCNDVGLSYSIYGFGKGNQVVIDKLRDVAKQCEIMLDCTKSLKPEDFAKLE